MGDEQLGQGQEAVRTMLQDDEKFRSKVEKLIKEKAFADKQAPSRDKKESED
jgi:hypothetical protein